MSVNLLTKNVCPKFSKSWLRHWCQSASWLPDPPPPPRKCLRYAPGPVCVLSTFVFCTLFIFIRCFGLFSVLLLFFFFPAWIKLELYSDNHIFNAITKAQNTDHVIATWGLGAPKWLTSNQWGVVSLLIKSTQWRILYSKCYVHYYTIVPAATHSHAKCVMKSHIFNNWHSFPLSKNIKGSRK